MAIQGYIIGISDNTSTAPISFWAGTGVATTDVIEDAEFITGLGAARIAAGTLQAQLADNHVEAYSVTKTVDYTTAIGEAGI